MSLYPIFATSWVVQLHVFVALLMILVTGAIFALRKGKRAHRILGWVWVLGMGTVALSSFWIWEIRQFGLFSLIHLLSILTLVSLVINVRAARRHNVRAHRAGMISLAAGALGIAGIFALAPGRLMFAVISGG